MCSQCCDSFVPLSPRITRAYGRAGLQYWASLYTYEGRAAQAVQRLKYSRSTALASPMASLLRAGAEAEALLDVDLIVPVPIHWSRRCVRGFNQSDLLASDLPTRLLAPTVLKRIKATRPQVGLSTEDRFINLQGAFRAQADLTGKRVLLIDDVLTSGQTARECADALKARGAAEVGVLTFAGAS